MNDKFERTFYGTIFAIRILVMWKLKLNGILGEKDYLMGVLVMFIGIAARRMKIFGILAGALGNLGYVIFLIWDWEFGKYFLVASQFLAGLLVGKVFFKLGFFFALGQIIGSLVTISSIFVKELFGEYAIEISVLLFLSVLQSILYYNTTKSTKKKLRNTLVEYYSSYPPQNLSVFLLYSSYFCFFVSYSSILLSFINITSYKYLPILYLSVNLILLLSCIPINYLFLDGFNKIIKQRLLIGLLGLSLIFLLSQNSEPVFFVTLLFLHYLWNTITEFDLYVYGKNKSTCHLWISTAAIGGCANCLFYLIFPAYLQFFKYCCSVLTLAVFIVFTPFFNKIHPHPSFLPIMYKVDHIIICQDCPYTIRKRIQQDLLNKLI